MNGLEILVVSESVALLLLCIGLGIFVYRYEKYKTDTEYTLEELQFGNAKATICYLDYLRQCKQNFIDNEDYESVPNIDKAIQEEENYLGITDEIKKANPGGIILQ